MNKKLRKILSFEECIPNIQHLLVEFFGKLVFKEHFEKKDQTKKFESFEFTLRKESVGLIMQFLNQEAVDKR